MSNASDSTVSPILEALYSGDSDKIDELVAGSPQLDVFEAAALGRTDRVRELLEEDSARANGWSPDGFTPLHLAAFFGHAETVALLLERGADAETVSRHEFVKVTPLHSAVAQEGAEDVGTVNVLLERGAPVDAAVEGGHTPLHSAAANGNVPIVEALLSHGADPQASRNDGKTPLDLARQGGFDEVARLLS
jgi:ankyrin repeat protein